MWSRFASASAVAPDAGNDAAGFAEEIARLVVERGSSVVYPAQEEAIDALYRASPALAGQVIIPYPGEAPLRMLRDKRELPRLAVEHGFEAAGTLAEGRAADLAEADLPASRVVKPVGKGGAIPTAVRPTLAKGWRACSAACRRTSRSSSRSASAVRSCRSES